MTRINLIFGTAEDEATETDVVDADEFDVAEFDVESVDDVAATFFDCDVVDDDSAGDMRATETAGLGLARGGGGVGTIVGDGVTLLLLCTLFALAPPPCVNATLDESLFCCATAVVVVVPCGWWADDDVDWFRFPPAAAQFFGSTRYTCGLLVEASCA